MHRDPIRHLIGPFFETLFRDVCYAARSLAHSPGFALVAALTLALGIGANSTTYLFMNGLLPAPAPFESPRELVCLYASYSHGFRWGELSYSDLEDAAEQSAFFSSVVGEGQRQEHRFLKPAEACYSPRTFRKKKVCAPTPVKPRVLLQLLLDLVVVEGHARHFAEAGLALASDF